MKHRHTHSMVNTHNSWLYKALEKLPKQQATLRSRLLRYGFALLMVWLAWLSREIIGPADVGLPLLTFFSATALATILAGIGPGVLAAVLGMLLGSYFYMPPYGEFSFTFASGHVLSNLVFMIDVALVALAMKALQIHQNKYHANRELLNAIVEGTTDGIFVKDMEGRYCYLNNAAVRNFGHPLENILGKTDAELHSGADLAVLKAQDQQVMNSAAPLMFENQRSNAQSGLRSYQLTKGLLHDERAQTIGLFGVVRDITATRQLEDALREKLSAQESLIRQTTLLPGAICSYQRKADGTPCFPYASPKFTNIFGLQPADVRHDGSAALARIHPQDLPLITATTQQAMNSSEGWNAAFRVNHPVRGEIWVEAFFQPSTDTQGERLWHGYLQDITARRRAEAQMRLAAEIFDMSVEGILVTNLQNRILAVNQAFLNRTGYTRAELVGQSADLIYSEHHNQANRDAITQALHTQGQWQGEAWSARKNGDSVLHWLSVNQVADDSGQVSHFISVFRDITLARTNQERMTFIGTHDDLTHLPNRHLLHDRLRQAVERAHQASQTLAVLFIDLDNFKLVNESLGHAQGDRLLREVADRLQSHVRAHDTLARSGGDEFVILLEDCPRAAAEQLAQRILDHLAQPYRMADQDFFAAASIGISFYPEQADTPAELLAQADAAVHRAKEQGRNNIQIFAGEMAERSKRRLDIEHGLRHALEHQELYLEYQPQIELSTGELVGCEALIRWNQNGRTISPLEFIPVAEETRLIIDIGEWVLHETCRQIRHWDALGLPPFTISVNISARHFLQANMFERLTQIVIEAGVMPARICLEITESAMVNVDAAMQLLSDLERFGFSTSVDDFGTGFSSLAHLKRFPLHELKIDRSFVDGIVTDRDDHAITSAIIDMASHLELRVVAEGVETHDHLKRLIQMGCHIGQGYFFSRPLGADKFQHWLQNRKAEIQPNVAGDSQL